MRSMILMALLTLVAGFVFAQSAELATSDETPAAEAASVPPDADAMADVKEARPFKIPAGYNTRTRGDKTVYCRKETVSGSRFGTEKCFTEEQLQRKAAEIEAARQELEKSMRACSTDTACANQ